MVATQSPQDGVLPFTRILAAGIIPYLVLAFFVAFSLWVGLYFTTPFAVFAEFLRNQREYRPSTDAVLAMAILYVRMESRARSLSLSGRGVP